MVIKINFKNELFKSDLNRKQFMFDFIYIKTKLSNKFKGKNNATNFNFKNYNCYEIENFSLKI